MNKLESIPVNIYKNSTHTNDNERRGLTLSGFVIGVVAVFHLNILCYLIDNEDIQLMKTLLPEELMRQ